LSRFRHGETLAQVFGRFDARGLNWRSCGA
jgi:hypothetical protein